MGLKKKKIVIVFSKGERNFWFDVTWLPKPVTKYAKGQRMLPIQLTSKKAPTLFAIQFMGFFFFA